MGSGRLFWMLLLIAGLFCAIALSGINPSLVKAQVSAVGDDDDADLPPIARGRIDKEEYLRLRDAHLNILRGVPHDKRGARVRAIQEMESQEVVANALAISPAVWTSIGPAPIPNGQTTPQTAVSGRTIAIAVHPTDSNILYVGTAQGG